MHQDVRFFELFWVILFAFCKPEKKTMGRNGTTLGSKRIGFQLLKRNRWNLQYLGCVGSDSLKRKVNGWDTRKPWNNYSTSSIGVGKWISFWEGFWASTYVCFFEECAYLKALQTFQLLSWDFFHTISRFQQSRRKSPCYLVVCLRCFVCLGDLVLWSQACGYIFHSSFLAFDFLIVATWIQPLSEAFEIYQDDASNTTVDMYPLVHPLPSPTQTIW